MKLKSISDEMDEIREVSSEQLQRKDDKKCFGGVYTTRQLKLIQAEYLNQVESTLNLARQTLVDGEVDIYLTDCGISEYLRGVADVYDALTTLTTE